MEKCRGNDENAIFNILKESIVYEERIAVLCDKIRTYVDSEDFDYIRRLENPEKYSKNSIKVTLENLKKILNDFEKFLSGWQEKNKFQDEDLGEWVSLNLELPRHNCKEMKKFIPRMEKAIEEDDFVLLDLFAKSLGDTLVDINESANEISSEIA